MGNDKEDKMKSIKVNKHLCAHVGLQCEKVNKK